MDDATVTRLTRPHRCWFVIAALPSWGCNPVSDHLPSAKATPDPAPASPSSASTERHAPPAQPEPTGLDFTKFTLHGSLVDAEGRSTKAQLDLVRRGNQWSGSAKEGNRSALTLSEVRFSFLESSDGRANYRLGYVADLCEHAAPSAKEDRLPWKPDPCAYAAGDTRPKRLRESELRVRIQTDTSSTISLGQAFITFALGSDDVSTLSSALLLSGHAQH